MWPRSPQKPHRRSLFFGRPGRREAVACCSIRRFSPRLPSLYRHTPGQNHTNPAGTRQGHGETQRSHAHLTRGWFRTSGGELIAAVCRRLAMGLSGSEARSGTRSPGNKRPLGLLAGAALHATEDMSDCMVAMTVSASGMLPPATALMHCRAANTARVVATLLLALLYNTHTKSCSTAASKWHGGGLLTMTAQPPMLSYTPAPARCTAPPC